MGLCPQITPGAEGRSLLEAVAVVLIGFFTRQCQILAELVVTAAHVLHLGGEQPPLEDMLLRDVGHLLLYF